MIKPEQTSPSLTGVYTSLRDLINLRYRSDRELLSGKVSTNLQPGQKASKIRGSGLDFAEVRVYQPGDDVRSIDWKVSARKQKVHTKLFHEEKERPVLVFVDQTQSMFFGSGVRLKSIAAAELGAVEIWKAVANGERIGGAIATNEKVIMAKPRHGTTAATKMLFNIAEANQSLTRETRKRISAPEAAANLLNLSKQRFKIVIISDFQGFPDDWEEIVKRLARKNSLDLVHIFDPIEESLPPPGRYTVSDGKEHAIFSSRDSVLSIEYEKAFNQKKSQISQLAKLSSVIYRNISTDTQSI